MAAALPQNLAIELRRSDPYRAFILKKKYTGLFKCEITRANYNSIAPESCRQINAVTY